MIWNIAWTLLIHKIQLYGVWTIQCGPEKFLSSEEPKDDNQNKHTKSTIDEEHDSLIFKGPKEEEKITEEKGDISHCRNDDHSIPLTLFYLRLQMIKLQVLYTIVFSLFLFLFSLKIGCTWRLLVWIPDPRWITVFYCWI